MEAGRERGKKITVKAKASVRMVQIRDIGQTEECSMSHPLVRCVRLELVVCMYL